jgi:DNA-binding IclR family transcriptional regulator
VRTTQRMLEVLQLFTMEAPEWSIDAAAKKLGLRQSTAYVYFRDLVDAALLVKARIGHYNLGPAVIVYDRITRSCDPVISLAQPLMKELMASAGVECVALLCRIYRMTVLCVAQEATEHADFAVSYERGRPMPLFRGAASKICLAHVERRKLRRYYEEFKADISKADLGTTWGEFKSALRRIRSTNLYITTGEIDAGRTGISAPIFSPEGEILGSLSLVVSEQATRGSQGLLEKLGSTVAEAATQLTGSLGAGSATAAASDRKLKGHKKKKKQAAARTGHPRRTLKRKRKSAA